MSSQMLRSEVEMLKQVFNPNHVTYVLSWGWDSFTQEDYRDMIRRHPFMKKPDHPFSTFQKWRDYNKGVKHEWKVET